MERLRCECFTLYQKETLKAAISQGISNLSRIIREGEDPGLAGFYKQTIDIFKDTEKAVDKVPRCKEY